MNPSRYCSLLHPADLTISTQAINWCPLPPNGVQLKIQAGECPIPPCQKANLTRDKLVILETVQPRRGFSILLYTFFYFPFRLSVLAVPSWQANRIQEDSKPTTKIYQDLPRSTKGTLPAPRKQHLQRLRLCSCAASVQHRSSAPCFALSMENCKALLSQPEHKQAKKARRIVTRCRESFSALEFTCTDKAFHRTKTVKVCLSLQNLRASLPQKAKKLHLARVPLQKRK